MRYNPKSKTNAVALVQTIASAVVPALVKGGLLEAEPASQILGAITSICGFVALYLRQKPGEQGRTYPEAVG